MNVQALVCYDRGYGIGKDNKLLYSIREDMMRFADLTHDTILIMGRKTYESLPKILPNRYHLVVSSNGVVEHPAGDTGQVGFVTRGYKAALDLALDLAERNGMEGVSIIGGASAYKSLKDDIGVWYLTEVENIRPADTYFFPEWVDADRFCEMQSRRELSKSGEEVVFRELCHVSLLEHALSPPLLAALMPTFRKIGGER